MSIRAVIFDLDGVLRHFDPAHQSAVEQAHGLEPGILGATGFGPELGRALLTGQLSRQEWGQAIGQAVGSVQAAIEWLAKPAAVDVDMIRLVDQVRRLADAPVVCLLTNGTDETTAELADAEITHRFDQIFNTAQIGVAKPSAEIYDHVTRSLGLLPEQIFFADDSQRNVDAALEFGWQAHWFQGRGGLLVTLQDRGLKGDWTSRE